MFRERLIDFYRKHNPACLDSIDDILKIFDGREEELFRVLEEKYADIHRGSQKLLSSSTLTNALLIGDNSSCGGSAQQSPYAENRTFNSKLDSQGRRDFGATKLAEQHSVYCSDANESTVLGCLKENGTYPRAKGRSILTDDAHNLYSLRKECDQLKTSNYALRCDVLVLQAENEALTRQRKDDEETMEKLRAHIDYHDKIEHALVGKVAASELRGKAVLSEDEFASIISASQDRLSNYYEEKISFMQMEINMFYKHAAERVKEKDAIITALKQLLSQC
ncbi:hypothetical protein ABB37_07275 [Leptomonas pyrrhocoris]|uniref:Uncharacterized protein n=1 Tax=Leptomonas pyrrhocoris TaxID=157538 RepID=A0A0N1J4H9_LEPPY|nr:hypothetical protein ABB37_07275 [Leptomonas pyrrhocoris]KPA76882.1 hypothetical protein ABB37_07275 [Leptomonas pyrrhocoris]|eukprot:XP_015655321.1 hypothetical protein ABB37_07275 [Leptomonas pyrrhocoris]